MDVSVEKGLDGRRNNGKPWEHTWGGRNSEMRKKLLYLLVWWWEIKNY